MTALADAPTQSLNILVVCPESGAENILAQIRKWNFQEESKHKKWHIHSTVHKEFDLFSALGNANKNIEQSILVPIGFYEQEIRNKLLHQEQKRLEIIVRPPRPLHYQKNELNDRPSSSLLKDKLLINVQNTLPALFNPPFDILEAFDGFNEYYAQLVRNQLEVAEVSRVIVAAEYRSSGLGEVIVDSLVTMAQEREQLDLIFLACKKDHERFYQRCGFEALKGIESDHFVNQTTQSIAMVQCLHHKRCAACFLDDQANELQGY